MAALSVSTRDQTMKSALRNTILLIATAAACVAGSSASQAQLTQIVACVEINPGEHPGIESRRRRHTVTDCDMNTANTLAFQGARAAASQALRNHCRASVLGVAAAAEICAAANLTVPTAGTSVSRPAVPAPGGGPIQQSIGIGTSKTGIRV